MCQFFCNKGLENFSSDSHGKYYEEWLGTKVCCWCWSLFAEKHSCTCCEDLSSNASYMGECQVEEDARASHSVEDAVWAASQLDYMVCFGGTSEVQHLTVEAQLPEYGQCECAREFFLASLFAFNFASSTISFICAIAFVLASSFKESIKLIFASSADIPLILDNSATVFA